MRCYSNFVLRVFVKELHSSISTPGNHIQGLLYIKKSPSLLVINLSSDTFHGIPGLLIFQSVSELRSAFRFPP